MHESRYLAISYFKLESLFGLHETSCESSHLNRIFFYKTAHHSAQCFFFPSFSVLVHPAYITRSICFLPLKNCFRKEAHYNTANLLNTENACALLVVIKIFL